MTKSISPNEIYLKESLEELLAQADSATVTYKKGNMTARLTIKDGEIKGVTGIKSKEEGQELLQTSNISYASFNDDAGTNYTYDTTNGVTLTAEINSSQGSIFKTYEAHDNKFRLVRETSPNSNLETVYTYHNNGDITAEQIDPNKKVAEPYLIRRNKER